MKLLTPRKVLQLNSKTKTYVLLVVVVAIWGVIGYKIWTGLNPELPEVIQQNFTVNFNPKTKTDINTFSVQTAERDPFLGTLALKQTKVIVTKKRKIISWLPVNYLGMIKKQGATQKIFVITINGNQHLMKQGQTIDSVRLIRGNTKTIVVRYKYQQKTFNLSQ